LGHRPDRPAIEAPFRFRESAARPLR
jgi:hypothetical protein